MSAVVQAPNTWEYIEQKVRRLTSSPTSATLSSSYIQQQGNLFYNSDFPYAIKLDQMRSVYSFYTRPYVDTYPLDVNYNQGVRDPLYVDGIQGVFYKDRKQFYNLFPKWPTKFEQTGGIAGGISDATTSNPCVITSVNHGLLTGDVVTITGVQGLTGLNGNTYTVTVLTVDTFSVSASVSGIYTGGGSWESSNSFNFYVSPTPFLRGEVTIGGIYSTGDAFAIADIPYIDEAQGATDTLGILQLQDPNSIISVPEQTSSAPGMKNLNTQNPGQNIVTNIGTVNYVTGQIVIRLPQGLQEGTNLTIWIAQYSTGRPYVALFWNNMFTIRPVPKLVHKITIETYLTPVQFMLSTDSPILNQWINYIAYGVAAEIMRDRNDFDAVAKLQEGMKRQEALVLERQGIEEIGNRNVTIFTTATSSNGWNQWYTLGGW